MHTVLNEPMLRRLASSFTMPGSPFSSLPDIFTKPCSWRVLSIALTRSIPSPHFCTWDWITEKNNRIRTHFWMVRTTGSYLRTHYHDRCSYTFDLGSDTGFVHTRTLLVYIICVHRSNVCVWFFLGGGGSLLTAFGWQKVVVAMVESNISGWTRLPRESNDSKFKLIRYRSRSRSTEVLGLSCLQKGLIHSNGNFNDFWYYNFSPTQWYIPGCHNPCQNPSS